MGENNFLANAICEYVKRSEKKGLVEMPLPTGFGKTHAVMQAISVMADRGFSSCLFFLELRAFAYKPVQHHA